MEYKIIRYNASYLTPLKDLLDTSFSIENKDKTNLVQWKYFDPFFDKKTTTYIAIDKNNAVISHYTNIPIKICRLNKTYKTMICTDMCTDRKYRGKGLISQLSQKVYKDVLDQNYDFSIGFSNDDGVQVDKNSDKYGYYIVGKFVRYFKFVVYKKNIKHKLIRTKTIAADFYSRESSYFKIKKDQNYMSWRYITKPNSEYDVYSIVVDDTACGYVVLRFIQNKCYIYDIISTNDDKENMINILRSIENKALEHRVRIVIYNVVDNFYWKNLFNSYKYFKKVNNTVNYYLTVKIHNTNLSKDLLLDKENWLFMNGDII